MSKFFIDRPVFAWVIVIIIMLTGALSILKLPIEQYPNIAPPSVTIKASYPGADSKTVENSVTQVIEQKLTGIDFLRYFSANSSNGASSITLTFEPEADPDIAQVQTQNRLQEAMSLLPLDVQNQGVSVTKSNDSFLLVVGFYSEDGSISQQELGDLLSSKVQDEIARINGVGRVTIFGEAHAMRVWLNPDKLFSYNLTAIDIKNAIKNQNIDISAGQLGAMPSVANQQINATITAQSKLETKKEFEEIVIKVNQNGSQIRLKDVARVEIGSDRYTRIARYKRKPAAGLAVSLATGANALDTANAIREKMDFLAPSFPDKVKIIYPYDTTPFVKLSIESVIKTLIEAIVLVFLVMYLFLQNFRATIIPTIAVPIVLLGTFGILLTFGFTINVLTMFALVLVIGLLVDDAIVVVENVERIMEEEDLSPKEATKKSMTQITPALIGITLILSAVFVPMAFFSGSAGAIYKQFSITIVASMALSILVALVFSPSLCATILRPKNKEKESKFFNWFNDKFSILRNFYQLIAEFMTKRVARFFVIYILLIGSLVYVFVKLPSSFLPNEDQGVMFLMIQTPPGSTAGRTLESAKKVEDYFLNQENANIDHLFTVVGFSFAGVAQNAAFGFIGLKDWDNRKRDDQSVFSISGRGMGALSQIKDAMAFAFFPPPIRELGNASGFDFQLIDRAGIGHEKLMSARNQMLGMAAKNPKLSAVRPNGLSDVPQFKIDLNIEKASAMGVAISDINETLQTAFGSSYVNDFLDNGRIKRVYVQADAEYRMLPEDIDKWYVRNNVGKMVPFSAFSTTKWVYGSPKLERFNGNSSLNIQGAPAKGISTGDAMREIENIVKKLPKGIDVEWSGISYEERLSGSQAPILYALSILIVFLCLAALYESWIIPISVIFTVPLGILGAVLAAKISGFNNDIYFQVALLTTVGLCARNAILIVEFAKTLYENGEDLVESTIKAAKLRFRPIIMTSMAFILGVTPLAIASGAGSASQNAIGVAVMGGMIASTTIAILFVPMFFVMIQKLSIKEKNEEEND